MESAFRLSRQEGGLAPAAWLRVNSKVKMNCDHEDRQTSNMKQQAVFIDRDGTISEEVGYINHVSRFRLFPYAAEAIKHLNLRGWLAIVITNQAGVARGYFSEDTIRTVHATMTKELESGG